MSEHEQLKARCEKLETALKYYANHIHWMGLTETSEFQTSFLAGQAWDMNGWSVAEQALAEQQP